MNLEANAWLAKDVNEFVELVGKNPFFVKFTKTDGSVRDMEALLFDPSSPEELVDLSKIDREKDYVRVYDTQNKGWRTIKITSIIKIYFMKH